MAAKIYPKPGGAYWEPYEAQDFFEGIQYDTRDQANREAKGFRENGVRAVVKPVTRYMLYFSKRDRERPRRRGKK